MDSGCADELFVKAKVCMSTEFLKNAHLLLPIRAVLLFIGWKTLQR